MKPGIDHFIEHHAAGLKEKRIGMVAHPASMTADGTESPDAWVNAGFSLSALFGPEHGVEGTAGAGVEIEHGHHTRFNCPVWSLYGDTRKPTPEMLNTIDILIYDLQDISVRCYTYVSTLRLILEACEESEVEVIVTDRPSPLEGIYDGPPLDPAFRTFISDFPGPLVYGLNSGQAAEILKQECAPNVTLRVIPCSEDGKEQPWIAPSPAITSAHAALCYPATVWVEAIQEVDAHRCGPRPFQEISAEWMNPSDLADRLNQRSLPGITFSASADHKLILDVTNPRIHKPAATGIHILNELQKQRGIKKFWSGKDIRPDWFDTLMGTDAVRKALINGTPAEAIIESWQPSLKHYASSLSRIG